MPSLPAIRASNARLLEASSSASSSSPLVAVFIGATSGIGFSTMQQLASHTRNVRIIFTGRNAETAAKVEADLRQRCPTGEFVFVSTGNLELIKEVDEACRKIKEAVGEIAAINLLVMSPGSIMLKKTYTSEGLDQMSTLAFYSRVRIIEHLLPLLRRPSYHPLARVLTIFAGHRSDAIDPNNIGGTKPDISTLQFRLRQGMMTNLVLEHFAATAPEVSFVHAYPGFVRTEGQDRIPGLLGVITRTIFAVVGKLIGIPLPESGERFLFIATSEKYPAKSGDKKGLVGVDGAQVTTAKSTDGVVGGGVYALNWDGEPGENKLLEKQRNEGLAEATWRHCEETFASIL